jgi:hypothetical protein
MIEVGQIVVLVEDVKGVPAGEVGQVMGVRDNIVLVGCRVADRLHLVMARAWEVLPETMYRRLCRRKNNE